MHESRVSCKSHVEGILGGLVRYHRALARPLSKGTLSGR